MRGACGARGSRVGSRRSAGPPLRMSACPEPKARSASRRTARSWRRLYSSTAATAATPRTSRPSWRSVMRALGGQLLPDAKRLLDVHRDHARDARLGHGDADQLLGHLHRDLVVADEQELRLRRHALHQVAEALGIAVVERRIDLVEQAEGRRVELEQREHQRDGGERLLAAGEQVDAGVALAGRLGHDLHPGVEDLLAGHQQLRLAAAEQGRKERAEMPVDAVEGLAQQLARLAVDAPDGVLQGVHRFLEVRGLGIQEALALAAGAELFERREVHRPELGDRLVDARDLPLQRRGARRALRLLGEPRFVGAGLAQLGVELLEAELRRLLLQAQLAYPLAQRRNPRVDLQPGLLQLAQRPGRGLDRVARFGERLLAGDARLDRAAERLAQRRDRVVGELLGQPGELLGGALDLAVDELHRSVDLADLGAAFALAEERVLRLALGLLRGAPLLGERRLGRRVRAARGLELGARGIDLGADALAAGLRVGERQRAALHLRADLVELGADLRAALAIALLRLHRLQLLDLAVVLRFLARADLQARLLQRRVAPC